MLSGDPRRRAGQPHLGVQHRTEPQCRSRARDGHGHDDRHREALPGPPVDPARVVQASRSCEDHQDGDEKGHTYQSGRQHPRVRGHDEEEGCPHQRDHRRHAQQAGQGVGRLAFRLTPGSHELVTIDQGLQLISDDRVVSLRVGALAVARLLTARVFESPALERREREDAGRATIHPDRPGCVVPYLPPGLRFAGRPVPEHFQGIAQTLGSGGARGAIGGDHACS